MYEYKMTNRIKSLELLILKGAETINDQCHPFIDIDQGYKWGKRLELHNAYTVITMLKEQEVNVTEYELQLQTIWYERLIN